MRLALGILWAVLVLLWGWSVKAYPTHDPDRPWDTVKCCSMMSWMPLCLGPFLLLALGRRREPS